MTSKIIIAFIFIFSAIGFTPTAFIFAKEKEPDLQAIVETLQQKIKELEQQIATLQTQLGEVKETNAHTSEMNQFTQTLQRGATGDEVKKLQTYLKKSPDIYPEGLVTGFFGPLTETAVKRLQEKEAIEVVGVVGPKTRAVLNNLVTSRTGNSGVMPPGLTSEQEIHENNLLATTIRPSGTSPAVATTTPSTATTTPSGTMPAIPAMPAIPSMGTGVATISANPAKPAIPGEKSEVVPPGQTPAPGIPENTPPPATTTPPAIPPTPATPPVPVPDTTPPSTIATVTSTTYIVSSGATSAETIANVSYGTQKSDFLGHLMKVQANQTWNTTGIFEPYVVTGNTLVVTAQDGVTKTTYTISTTRASGNFFGNVYIAPNDNFTFDTSWSGPFGDQLNLTVVPVGFSNPVYNLNDSFGGTSISNANISTSGNFSWTPVIGDVGYHHIIVTISDSASHTGRTTVNFTIGR